MMRGSWTWAIVRHFQVSIGFILLYYSVLPNDIGYYLKHKI